MLEFFFNGECSQKVYYVSPYNSKQFAFLKFIFLYIVHFSVLVVAVPVRPF